VQERLPSVTPRLAVRRKVLMLLKNSSAVT
jgi:hypothetical protein